jgi:Protein of unknown function (DUF1761)
MTALSIPAVLVSGAAGGIVTPLWYIAFKDVHARLVQPGSRQIVDFKAAPVSSKVIDLLRGFLVAFVLAYLVDATEVTTVAGAVGLAALLWVGFPVVLLIAPVIWGGESWKLAVLHAGDWLVKLVVMGAVLGLWT